MVHLPTYSYDHDHKTHKYPYPYYQLKIKKIDISRTGRDSSIRTSIRNDHFQEKFFF